jgi:NAD(P)-dependent dehydrogenase (short-subunit alcohol dehydrogenase family)
VRREQVILISGCSSGIGRAAAIEAARRGHRVFASARDPQTIASLGEQTGARIRTLRLDVQDAASCAAAVQSVLAEAGRLDALVNNAGYAQYGSVEDVSIERWQAQFDVNVFGVLRLTQAALPAMREARSGTIVNVSSVGGKVSVPFASPYCAAKHALEAISDALRVEVSPFGIRVAVIEPGSITTRFEERARREADSFLKGAGPYSPFYGGAERAMDVELRMGELPPEAVARVIVDAVESQRPRTRYPLTLLSRLLIPLRRLLPDRYFDWQMRRMLKLPSSPLPASGKTRPPA